MNNVRVEYVPTADTMADIALHYGTSSGLRTTTTILLGLLVIFSFMFNIILLATIISSRKLRSVQLFILFCNLAVLNLLDIVSGMFISLLYIANGYWFSDLALCRFTTAMHQLSTMELFMSTMIMAVERATTLIFPRRLIFDRWRTLAFTAFLWFISICFVVPILTYSIPVKPFRFRYTCDIDSKVPILFPIVRIVIYGICLFISIICFGALRLRGNKHRTRSLPLKPHENPQFIKQSRALHEYLSLAKLVLLLTILFILFVGPYIILSFYVEIRNSYEMLENYDAYEAAQDADTILNWLRFLYPLLAPLTIYASCAEIWLKVQGLVLCRGPKTITLGKWANDQGSGCGLDENNVMTLFATSEGLHLRIPQQTVQQQTDDKSDIADMNSDANTIHDDDEISNDHRASESTVITAANDPAVVMGIVNEQESERQVSNNDRRSSISVIAKQSSQLKRKTRQRNDSVKRKSQKIWRY